MLRHIIDERISRRYNDIPFSYGKKQADDDWDEDDHDLNDDERDPNDDWHEPYIDDNNWG
jgi:hypothetical protein